MSLKLNDPSTGPKTYWSILNRFLNGAKVQKLVSRAILKK